MRKQLSIFLILILSISISSYAMEVKVGDFGIITPVSFGAKGDGVTDDSPAFRLAASAIPNEGGIFFIPVPPVKYYIKTPIVFTQKRIIIRGAGHGSLLWTDKDITVLDINPTSPYEGGTVLEDFAIEGNRAGDNQTGIRVRKVTKSWRMSGIKTTNLKSVGVLVEDSRWGNLHELYITGSGIGLYLYGNAEDVTITRVIGGCFGPGNGIGIQSDRVEGLKIEGAAIQGNTINGILMRGGYQNELSNLYISDNPINISVTTHPTYGVMRGLHIHDLFLGSGTPGRVNIKLDGDKQTLIDGAGYWQINASDGKHLTITPNSISPVLSLSGVYAGGIDLSRPEVLTQYPNIFDVNNTGIVWK